MADPQETINPWATRSFYNRYNTPVNKKGTSSVPFQSLRVFNLKKRSSNLERVNVEFRHNLTQKREFDRNLKEWGFQL